MEVDKNNDIDYIDCLAGFYTFAYDCLAASYLALCFP